MKMEEMATRITRLELRQEVLTALVHTLLPAIPPSSKPAVLERFGQYCVAAESKVFSEDWEPLQADLMSAALEEAHNSVRRALAESDATPQNG